MSFCVKCGAPNSLDDAYCAGCGRPLSVGGSRPTIARTEAPIIATATPLQPPIASEPQPHQDPPRRGPLRKIIGIAIVVTLIGVGLYVPGPFDWLSQSLDRDKSGASSLKDVNVEGHVASELLALASGNTLLVDIGGSSALANPSEGVFKVKGHQDTTGLISVSVGGKTIGLDVLPKPEGFPLDPPVVSYRSTAVSLILLTPGVAVGDPVTDLLLRDAILSNPDIEALATSLAEEAQIEGKDYLDELSDASSELRAKILQWFFYDPHTRGAGGPGSRKAISKGQVLIGSSSIPLSCDVGLIPTPRLEYDNVCFTVVAPKEDQWEKTEFPATLNIHVENRSPRWVAIFKADQNGGSNFVGAVGPKVWTPPNVQMLMQSAVAKFIIKPDIKNFEPMVGQWGRSNAEFEFQIDGAELSDEIVTLSFGDPKEDDLNTRISELGIQNWTAATAILTGLTNYVLPILNIVLDIAGPKNPGVLSGSCDDPKAKKLWKQVLLELVEEESFVELGQGASRGLQEMDLQSLVQSEVVKRVFSFVILDQLGISCNEDAPDLLYRLVDCLSPSPKGCGDLPDTLKVIVTSSLLNSYLQVVPAVRAADTIFAIGTLGASTLDLMADINRFGNGSRYPVSSLTSSRVCGELTKLFEPYSTFAQSGEIKSPNDLLNSIEDFSGAIALISNAGFFSEQKKAWKRFEDSPPPDDIKEDVGEISRLTGELADLINDKGRLGAIAGAFSSNDDLTIAVEELEKHMSNVWKYYRTNCADIDLFNFGS